MKHYPDPTTTAGRGKRAGGRSAAQRHDACAPDNLRRSYVPPVLAVEPPREDPTLALFARWAAEDATDDPEEIARRNREWEETKTNLQANRFSLEGRTDFRVLLGDGEDNPQEKAS